MISLQSLEGLRIVCNFELRITEGLIFDPLIGAEFSNQFDTLNLRSVELSCLLNAYHFDELMTMDACAPH